MKDLIRANRLCLEQALGLLDRLGDAQYASPRGNWSPVGAQLRHVIEHYQCFIEGVRAGRVDYDARRRDPTIEGSRARAREAIEEIATQLDELGVVPAAHPVRVQIQCAEDDPGPMWADSSAGRELQFLVSHSIHHFALIKLLLAGDLVALDPDFGTAPSTVTHARSLG